MPRRLAIDFPKLCVLILAGSVVYNEYLAYWVCSLYWPSLPLPQGATVLLFLADPQIQGLSHEPAGPLGSIRRWDSDRYLHKGYSWAHANYNISASIFLGDLLDEGSETGDPATYSEYVERFNSIYPSYSEHNQRIYLPGDNDIGGEGWDKVTDKKIEMFVKHFGRSEPVYRVGEGVEIVPISRLTERGSFNLTLKTDKVSQSAVVLAVSHVPVLPLNGRFSERVMDLVRPAVVFSAHDHTGYLFTAERESRKPVGNIARFRRSSDPAPFTMQTKDSDTTLSSKVWEVVVPTCSYRMGVREMALGLAVVEPSGEVTYANLWLPSRFSLLFIYLACVCLVGGITILRKFIHLRRLCTKRTDMQAIYRARYQPLLGGATSRNQD